LDISKSTFCNPIVAIVIKNKHEIEMMRRSGRLAQRILNRCGEAAQTGTSTQDLDKIARRLLEEAGARSPFLGYKRNHKVPYPGAICTSVNDAVVHGVPVPDPLGEGDIVSIDCGVILNGWIGDTAGTFAVGVIPANAERLMRITREALYLGIAQAKVGNHIGDISYAVQKHVESHGYSVVRDLVGHGVGRSMHEDPNVPNFGRPHSGPKLRPGMTIAIEPMVNEGKEDVYQLEDGWTVATADSTLSSHFEHTVAILSDGPEILTIDE
jgi:methionyl aminopeptidase